MKSQKHIFIFARPWSRSQCELIDQYLTSYKSSLDKLVLIDPILQPIADDLQEIDLDDVVQHCLDYHLRAVHQGENDWLDDWDRRVSDWKGDIESTAYTESIEDLAMAFTPFENQLSDDQQDTLNDLTEDLSETYSILYTTVIEPLYTRGIMQTIGDLMPNGATFYDLNGDVLFEVLK